MKWDEVKMEENQEEQMIVGWKSISHLLYGIPIPTLKKWHYQYLKMPYDKSYPSKQGRVIISKTMILKWFENIRKLYPALYNIRYISK